MEFVRCGVMLVHKRFWNVADLEFPDKGHSTRTFFAVKGPEHSRKHCEMFCGYFKMEITTKHLTA